MIYRNLAEVHRLQAEHLGPRSALRFRQHGLWHDITWQRYRADALACAAALVGAGVQPGDRVGLLAENSADWLIADMGILAAAAVNVPPHAPLTGRQVQFQLADAGTCWLFVSSADQLVKMRLLWPELPDLRGVVVFERTAAGSDAQSWSGFLQRGRQLLQDAAVREELARREAVLGLDDLATIMYTSGTTGNPKGVMLTHGNLLSNSCAALEAEGSTPDDLVLTWLPFSHIYARTVDHYQTLVAGTTVCLARSAETLLEDLAEVRPTHLSAVPRFYEKVLAAVRTDDPEETGRRLRSVFGKRITWLGSGGAPLPPCIGEVYLAAGLPLCQGYGLTESSPVISFNRRGRARPDTVGEPLPGIEVCIAPDGEVVTRGPHVMRGYWNNPQATVEALRDGWLYTGDLGRLEPDGHLKITGRKKELLVLSNGKKLVPSYIEGLLLADPCIDQAVVFGEGRNFLTALIVPHWENLRQALGATDANLDAATPATLVQAPQVYPFLQERMQTALRDVASWERVKKFVVLPQPFTVAADELTVSLKLRRGVILQHYARQLEALYREGERGTVEPC